MSPLIAEPSFSVKELRKRTKHDQDPKSSTSTSWRPHEPGVRESGEDIPSHASEVTQSGLQLVTPI